MPLLNYQLFIFFRKFFGLGQFAELEALRLAQLNLVFHVENRFPAAVADMDMNWAMVVAVKEKPESVLFKNVRHGGNYFAGSNLPTCEPMKPAPPVTRKFMAES
jgi:hypothetical protein